MQNVNAQASSSNFTTPAQPREDNASLLDEKQPTHKGREIALEKDTHVRPTSGSAPKRPLPVPATPTKHESDKPPPNRSLLSRVIAFIWKALVFTLKAYVVLVVIVILYTLVVDAIVPATKATWMGLEIASSWVEWIFFPICCMLFLFWHWIPAPARRRRGPRLPTEVPPT